MGIITSIKRLLQIIFHTAPTTLEDQREKQVSLDTPAPSLISDSSSTTVSHDQDTSSTDVQTRQIESVHSGAPSIIQSFYFVEDKLENRGEDAPPICAINASKGLIAVFDGMGGAGAKKYRNALNEEFTGAYLGSRFARNFVEHWYNDTYSVSSHVHITTSEIANLKQALVSNLSHKLNDYTSPSTTVVSKMRRTLPTTMASVFFKTNSSECQYDVVWAGDSRAYRLHANGFQQLTIDDTRRTGTSTISDIMQDSPMNNCISIDQEFQLNHQQFMSALPIILCVATDGCFGYLPSPIHFEHLLLDTLMNTHTPDEWAAQIINRLKPVAADDYSMALICLGWTDFKSMQISLLDRYTFIQQIIMEFNQIQTTIHQVNVQIDHLNNEKLQHNAKLEELSRVYWQNHSVSVDAVS